MNKRWPKGCCGKTLYPTKGDAETRMAYLQVVEPVKHGGVQRAYKCDRGCAGWHLTSKTGVVQSEHTADTPESK